VCFTSRKPKREEKSFLGGGSFFFAFFHEKFLWMGEFLGTQPQSNKSSKITNHHLLVTSS
jgi:hypothetical protein